MESRSESGCRRLVETSMGVSIANRLHTPFIGVLDSDLSNQFEEFDGIFSTTAYPLSGDQHPVHLRGYTLVSNLPITLPHDVSDNYASAIPSVFDESGSCLTSQTLSISSSLTLGPFPDLRHEVFETSANHKHRTVSRLEKEIVSGYADVNQNKASDSLVYHVRMALPPLSHLASLLRTSVANHCTPESVASSCHLMSPFIGSCNFSRLTDSCLADLKSMYLTRKSSSRPALYSSNLEGFPSDPPPIDAVGCCASTSDCYSSTSETNGQHDVSEGTSISP